MIQIKPKHLNFVEEAAKAFEENPRYETYMNDDETLIALRYGMDRDCVVIYELGEGIANFTQQVDAKYPAPRKEVAAFAREMEIQLAANDHKGGWENCTNKYLMNQLDKNLGKLNSCTSHEEFRKRCVNIANFAMMLFDNDRRVERRSAITENS